MPDSRPQAGARRADPRRVRVALTLSVLLLAALPAAASAETRIIVKRDPGLTAGERADIRRDAGVKHVRTLALPNTELVTTADPRDALATLRQDPDVRYAELDRVRHAFLTDDPYSGDQWGLANLGQAVPNVFGGTTTGTADADMDVPEAWALGATGAGITVAVVDSGIDASHPDFTNADTTSQIDTAQSRGFVGDGDTGYVDTDGHGTHVSGIIAAARDNQEGISGIAPDAKILALKALSANTGSDADIAEAFNYAGSLGIPVVNASLGGEGASQTLTDSMANHPGTLYVIAAGNGGDDNDTLDMWPCNAPAPNVICVGASTERDGRSGYSNYGLRNVDLFAPGDDITAPYPMPDAYAIESGTSMAAPAVAAEAALVLSAAPALTTSRLKSIILAATDAKAPFECRSVTGGRANAATAVGFASAPPATPAFDCDHDGVRDTLDACPAAAAATANGCPAAPVVTPAPTPTTPATPAPADADGDGRPDASDLCPAEPAATTTGCPVPGLLSLSVKVLRSKHRATFKVRTTRSATVALVVERRVCNSHGKRCRWRSVYDHAKGSRSNAATFTVRKLIRGRYRVNVRLSSPAGKASTVRKPVRL